MLNHLPWSSDTPRTAVTGHLLKIALVGVIGFSGAQARQCGGDTYAEGSPLTWNARLRAAAQAHSEDMTHMGRLSHEGSEGGVLADRLAAVGYEASAWAENVASGQQNATTVVAAWLDSPGHCANIMSADYTEFGVGIDRDKSGTRYWTLDLAVPRD